MKRSLYIILCLILGVALSGCIEEYEADIPSEDSDLLVVEGTICSGKLNKFILTRTKSINAAYSYPIVAGAKVSVRGSDGSEYQAFSDYEGAWGSIGSGNYYCQVGTLNPDVDYYLHIETDGEIYESTPQKPLRSEKIADVRGVQNTPESNIDILVTPEAPFDPDKVNYYSWTCDETWEVHPDYTTNMYYDTERHKPIFKMHQFPERGWMDETSTAIMVGSSTNYQGRHIERLKLYDIDRSDRRIYHRYSGLIHQRAITKAEYEYDLARRQAGEDMGGLFTPQPSALPTNIHCLTSDKRVIGYVGCSLNTGDYRFFLDTDDFSVYRTQGGGLVWVEKPTSDDCCRMVALGYYLVVWSAGFPPTTEPPTSAWARLNQLDVRTIGAYIEEPEFWKLTKNVSY